MQKDKSITMTSAEVRNRIRKDLEKNREENKAMLREAKMKLCERIFKKKGKTKN